MPRSILNPILLGALCVLALLSWAIGGDTSEPNYEFLPGMVYSIPYDSFAANPNFPDGKTLQPPIPGTIARGQLPLYLRATEKGAARASRELQNPFAPGDADQLRRGAKAYAIFCIPCHGPAGRGDGLVTQRGFPPPPSLLTYKSQTMADGQLFYILTRGQGNMPPYAAQVTFDDRWKIILHIRSLQKKEAAALAQQESEAAALAQQANGDEQGN